MNSKMLRQVATVVAGTAFATVALAAPPRGGGRGGGTRSSARTSVN